MRLRIDSRWPLTERPSRRPGADPRDTYRDFHCRMTATLFESGATKEIKHQFPEKFDAWIYAGQEFFVPGLFWADSEDGWIPRGEIKRSFNACIERLVHVGAYPKTRDFQEILIRGQRRASGEILEEPYRYLVETPLALCSMTQGVLYVPVQVWAEDRVVDGSWVGTWDYQDTPIVLPVSEDLRVLDISLESLTNIDDAVSFSFTFTARTHLVNVLQIYQPLEDLAASVQWAHTRNTARQPRRRNRQAQTTIDWNADGKTSADPGTAVEDSQVYYDDRSGRLIEWDE